MTTRLLLCLGCALLTLAGLAAGALVPESGTPVDMVLTAREPAKIDTKTRELVARGDARFEYGDWAMTADEIRVNGTTREAVATGHVVLFRPGFRLLAERARVEMATGRVEAFDFRFGQPPMHAAGRYASGTVELMELEDVDLVYGDPGPLAPRGSARVLRVRGDGTLEPEDLHFSADGLRLGIGSIPVFAFTGLGRDLKAPHPKLESRGGIDGELGLHVGLGAYFPYLEGIRPGGSIDVFSKRGVLAGPGVRYDATRGDTSFAGRTDLAFIHDSGDRDVDSLGRPIGASRAFWSWQHQQHSGERWTLNGELNWWGDSAVYRDFREDLFDRNQDPDTFLEGSLNGPGYIISALARVRVNDFQAMPERLPEVRFDLLPTPTGLGGALLELNAGVARLREQALDEGPDLRADRIDVYTRLSRTLSVTRGVTFTPVAGGRMTHYGHLGPGRPHYTRWLGELGFDASLRATRIKELEKPVWGFDGLRHVVEPRLEYRYIPGPSGDQPALPEIDRPAFLTQLQPLGLADRRDIDTLGRTHALRLSLDNLLETRRPDHGSRQLVRFNLATDLRLDPEPGQDRFSDVHTELLLTPADWLQWWFFMRVGTGADSGINEFNTRLLLVDSDAWSAGVGGNYLEGSIEQVHLFGRYRLDEARELFGAVRYDALEQRFNEVQVGLQTRIAQNWTARLGAYFRDGARRESNFGLRIDLRFLEF